MWTIYIETFLTVKSKSGQQEDQCNHTQVLRPKTAWER